MPRSIIPECHPIFPREAARIRAMVDDGLSITKIADVTGRYPYQIQKILAGWSCDLDDQGIAWCEKCEAYIYDPCPICNQSPDAYKPTPLPPGLNKTQIAFLSISVLDLLDEDHRLASYLFNAGIRTINDLLQRTQDQLLKIANLGSGSLEQIRDSLEDLGIRQVLGINLRENT